MEMHERVKAGDIGPVWFSEATYLQDWLLDETDYDWRCHPELGGATRAISDIGSHCFDTLQYMWMMPTYKVGTFINSKSA